MSLAGIGMLCTRTDIEAADEAEFNRWYDKEHMEERVSIPGFLDARRYVAIRGRPKYLNLYETRSLAVLDSPPYLTRLANQTAWSMEMLGKVRNFRRTVGSIGVSLGFAHGTYLGLIDLDPVHGREALLRGWIADRFAPLVQTDGLLSAHLLESDPTLSVPPPGLADAKTGEMQARAWFVMVEGTDPDVVGKACAEVFAAKAFNQRGIARRTGFGFYRLHGTYGKRDGIG